MKQRVKINTKGMVQGVGFRPYIYNLANKYNLTGFVLNNSGGVYIELEGEVKRINEFLNNFKIKSPSLSKVENIRKKIIPVLGGKEFKICSSKNLDSKSTFISPDIAICKECSQELEQESDRRYRFGFINCTNCGPRFTVVKDIPYDRANTTMDKFKMCNDCLKEYSNQSNRRFHAQTVSCYECGPKLELFDRMCQKVEVDDPIKKSVELLKQGYILAVKGLGGYHLACNAYDNNVVSKLRDRKKRPRKPFALMGKDLKEVKDICMVSKEEEEILVSSTRPILLLRKKPSKIAKKIAPGMDELGIMLPYTSVHILLLQEFGSALVMTSGNMNSESIIKDNHEAFRKLKGTADYFLVHNRKIYMSCDDSVLRIVDFKHRGENVDNKKIYFIRRSRGYVPAPIEMSSNFNLSTVAFGGQLKNVFCLSKNKYAILSQYIGDLDNISNIRNFKHSLAHFIGVFSINPKVVACDLHPDYTSTQLAAKYADENSIDKFFRIQHHHAHIVSCMAENNLNENIIGVSWDGTGYGDDGAIWGGEFLIVNRKSFKRKAHLEYVPLPGGDKAIKEPWRMALSWLYKVYGEGGFNLDIDLVKGVNLKDRKILKSMIDNDINSPYTSSIGRLFSAISSLLLKTYKENYEGESAIMLEHLARKNLDIEVEQKYTYKIEELPQGQYVICVDKVIKGIVDDLLKSERIKQIAYRFHITLCFIILEVCSSIRENTGLKKIVLSGGVFQNLLLLNNTISLLKKKKFDVFIHHKVPANDGGICLGQAVIANAQIEK